MGLLDSALGMLGSMNQGNNSNANMMQAVIGMLSNSQAGGGSTSGLQGLISAFQQAGLADIVQSWVGTGQNLPVSAAQIQQALGGGHLQQLAETAGVSHEDAASHLAEFLPGIINHLTPNGQVPESHEASPADMLQQFTSLFAK